MARTLRNGKLDTRTARAKLAERREPYWTCWSKAVHLATAAAGKQAPGSRAGATRPGSSTTGA